MDDNPLPRDVNEPVVHKHRKLAKQRTVLYLDPRLVEEAQASARRHGYEAGIHGLIEAHILLGLIWDRANPDKKHAYTVDVINDPELFEKELRDIHENPPKEWGSWIARRAEERRRTQDDKND